MRSSSWLAHARCSASHPMPASPLRSPYEIQIHVIRGLQHTSLKRWNVDKFRAHDVVSRIRCTSSGDNRHVPRRTDSRSDLVNLPYLRSGLAVVEPILTNRLHVHQRVIVSVSSVHRSDKVGIRSASIERDLLRSRSGASDAPRIQTG